MCELVRDFVDMIKPIGDKKKKKKIQASRCRLIFAVA